MKSQLQLTLQLRLAKRQWTIIIELPIVACQVILFSWIAKRKEI